MVSCFFWYRWHRWCRARRRARRTHLLASASKTCTVSNMPARKVSRRWKSLQIRRSTSRRSSSRPARESGSTSPPTDLCASMGARGLTGRFQGFPGDRAEWVGLGAPGKQRDHPQPRLSRSCAQFPLTLLDELRSWPRRSHPATAMVAGTSLVLEDLSLVQFELYRGGGDFPPRG